MGHIGTTSVNWWPLAPKVKIAPCLGSQCEDRFRS